MAALATVEPCGTLLDREAHAAESQEIEDRFDDAADWIRRLFRGVDEGTGKPMSGGRGGEGGGGGSPGARGSGGDDGGSDDGGGDDGGGDDGGGDD